MVFQLIKKLIESLVFYIFTTKLRHSIFTLLFSCKGLFFALVVFAALQFTLTYGYYLDNN